MAWYDIPKIKPRYLYDENKKVRGIIIKIQDFKQFIEKLEDLHDIVTAERIKKENKKFYSLEEIEKMLERKVQ